MIYCIFAVSFVLCIIIIIQEHTQPHCMLCVLLKFKKVAADNLSVRQQSQFHIAVNAFNWKKKKKMILMTCSSVRTGILIKYFLSAEPI